MFDVAEFDRLHRRPLVRLVERGRAVRPLPAEGGQDAVTVGYGEAVVEMPLARADQVDAGGQTLEQVSGHRSRTAPTVLGCAVARAVRPGAVVSRDERTDRIGTRVRVAHVF